MRFSREHADHVCIFFTKYLRHVKGKWAGTPFDLLPWQEHLLRWVFGWRNDDGTRVVRTVYVEVPRKNGKSSLCAGVALYLLIADQEPGVEVYSCAADRDQAAIVFELAKQMGAAEPALAKRVKPYRRSLVAANLSGSYKPLSADVPNKHGLNAHGVIFDELHAQPNRDLWDVMVTSTGARQQPLIMAITTAGFDRNSICWEVHEYARKILNGTILDPTVCAAIYKADEDDDWEDPAVWRKANPSLGHTITEEFLQTECNRAKENPAFQNTFRRLYLNQWTQQETRWLDMKRWDASAGMVVPERFKGKRCYIGLDLATTTDIAAMVQVFKENDKYYVIPHFFIPEESAREKEKRDRVPYLAWSRQKLVHLTPGNVIDYTYIEEQFDRIASECKVAEVAYDRWNADMLVQRLQSRGVTVVPVAQGFASMAAPSKFLEKLVAEGKLVHGANPVLRWMADNVVARIDDNANVMPSKAKSTQKIDGIVALILALSRAMVHLEKESVYKRRGILAV